MPSDAEDDQRQGLKHDKADLTPLTMAIRKHLKAEIARTGLNARALFSSATDLPDGLTASLINRWIGGLVLQAPQAHVAYVIEKWRARSDNAGRVSDDGKRLPSRGRRFPKPGENWIHLTTEMAEHLRTELTRTGLDSKTVLAGTDNLPELLTPRTILGWLYHEAKTADGAAWAFVMARLAAAPNAPPLPLPMRKPRKPKTASA